MVHYYNYALNKKITLQDLKKFHVEYDKKLLFYLWCTTSMLRTLQLLYVYVTCMDSQGLPRCCSICPVDL